MTNAIPRPAARARLSSPCAAALAQPGEARAQGGVWCPRAHVNRMPAVPRPGRPPCAAFRIEARRRSGRTQVCAPRRLHPGLHGRGATGKGGADAGHTRRRGVDGRGHRRPPSVVELVAESGVVRRTTRQPRRRRAAGPWTAPRGSAPGRSRAWCEHSMLRRLYSHAASTDSSPRVRYRRPGHRQAGARARHARQRDRQAAAVHQGPRRRVEPQVLPASSLPTELASLLGKRPSSMIQASMPPASLQLFGRTWIKRHLRIQDPVVAPRRLADKVKQGLMRRRWCSPIASRRRHGLHAACVATGKKQSRNCSRRTALHNSVQHAPGPCRRRVHDRPR